MKINFKLRLKNKTTLVSLIACVVAFIYQLLGIFNVVPAISEATIMQLFSIVINVLVAIGVIVDPTTAGLSDSAKAMEYVEPRKEVE